MEEEKYGDTQDTQPRANVARINNEVWWEVISRSSSSQIHSPIQDRLARRGGGREGEAFERGGGEGGRRQVNETFSLSPNFIYRAARSDH
jgi:hypothetical protein